MSFTTTSVVPTGRSGERSRDSLERTLVGCFLGMMGGVRLGLVSADPPGYRHVAHQALCGFVRSGWRECSWPTPPSGGSA
jgi:hypothetical protein